MAVIAGFGGRIWQKTFGNWRFRRNFPLYLMLVPMLISLAVFNYAPMYGLLIAFQEYDPLLGFKGSPFVGLLQFQRLFSDPDVWNVTRNTVVIATGKIILGQLFSIGFALLLNEVRVRWYKRSVQTISYVLHFVSWVIYGGILLDILRLSGAVNRAIAALGLQPVSFLGNPRVFPLTMIVTDAFKGFGFGAIIYLAALTSIDPTLHEAAAVDGATRWQRIRHVTLPGIAPTIVLMTSLSLGSILNAGFEQILVLYNQVVYSTGDIIDTYVYRTSLLGYQFSFGTAVGMLKSVAGFGLLSLSYWLADRFANYRIF
jgi:putative aldouronate transport system permease protein